MMDRAAIYAAISLGFAYAHGDSAAEFLVRFAFVAVVAEAFRATLKSVFN